MNRIDFNQVGGFPMTTNILGKMQTAFSLFNAFGSIVGDKTIISGCVVNGSETGSGVVYVKGEPFEFRGGATQSKVIIREDVEMLLYQNNNAYPSIKNRYIQFGTGVGAMDWVDFKRGFPTSNIDTLIQRIVDLEARPTVGNIPVGLIALWGQAANLIPAGWAEYTQLRGRVAIGLNPDDLDYAAIGNFGGAKNKTLGIDEIPEHSHDYNKYRLDQEVSTNGNGVRSINKNSIDDSFETTKAGGGQAFSIMNPYRVVQYIQYVG